MSDDRHSFYCSGGVGPVEDCPVCATDASDDLTEEYLAALERYIESWRQKP